MIKECDNFQSCHNLTTISEDENAIRVVCNQCWHQYVVRKDWRGSPEKRSYAKLFKKDILQPKENLFYRYYSNYL